MALFKFSCEKRPRTIGSWSRLGFRFSFRWPFWVSSSAERAVAMNESAAIHIAAETRDMSHYAYIWIRTCLWHVITCHKHESHHSSHVTVTLCVHMNTHMFCCSNHCCNSNPHERVCKTQTCNHSQTSDHSHSPKLPFSNWRMGPLPFSNGRHLTTPIVTHPHAHMSQWEWSDVPLSSVRGYCLQFVVSGQMSHSSQWEWSEVSDM